MAHWKKSICTVLSTPTLSQSLIIFPRDKRLISLDHEHDRVTFQFVGYRPIDLYYRLYFVMSSSWLNGNGKENNVAEKWVPKACDCFQRKDFGTLLVVGTTILVFNEKYELQQQIEKLTYYEALQEVLLMVGALDLKLLTTLNEEDK